MTDKIHVLKKGDKEYPPLLAEIIDAPKKIYVRGNKELLSHPNLFTVVGSRKANIYGRQCASEILPPLAKAGMPLVSGLAYGIDSLAHKACVDQQKQTVAVLGSGIDDASIYPKANIQLAHEILKHDGVLLSEHEPKAPTYPSNFPKRNRIIAGLTKGTLILQADIRSGSLITARLALEYNRDIFAIPGPINDPLSNGTNLLIQSGAHPIMSAQDILSVYEIDEILADNNTANLPKNHRSLLDKLTRKPQHIDIIAEAANLTTHTASSILAELELADQVQHVGNMKYIQKT